MHGPSTRSINRMMVISLAIQTLID